jgi:hypothetical protein
MGVNCCHANQDKFWVQDPDGVEWEVYHLNYDLEDEVASHLHERRRVCSWPRATPAAPRENAVMSDADIRRS